MANGRNTQLKAVYTNSFELLKQLNTHSVEKLKQNKRANFGYGTLLDRAERVVTDRSIEVSYVGRTNG